MTATGGGVSVGRVTATQPRGDARHYGHRRGRRHGLTLEQPPEMTRRSPARPKAQLANRAHLSPAPSLSLCPFHWHVDPHVSFPIPCFHPPLLYHTHPPLLFPHGLRWCLNRLCYMTTSIATLQKLPSRDPHVAPGSHNSVPSPEYGEPLRACSVTIGFNPDREW